MHTRLKSTNGQTQTQNMHPSTTTAHMAHATATKHNANAKPHKKNHPVPPHMASMHRLHPDQNTQPPTHGIPVRSVVEASSLSCLQWSFSSSCHSAAEQSSAAVGQLLLLVGTFIHCLLGLLCQHLLSLPTAAAAAAAVCRYLPVL
jgi:hypothetical protein